MTALYSSRSHLSVLCTRKLDPARWKIHTVHSWYYLPSARSPPRHPGSGLNRPGLITFPGVRYYPSGITCFWTTGAGESSLRTLCLYRVTTLNHHVLGGTSQFYCSYMCWYRKDLPFHHLFPTRLFAALVPLL